MTTQTTIAISTIFDLARSDMTLGLHCQPCGRWVEILPAEWLDGGKPDVDYIKQRFTCSVCGGNADKQVRPRASGMDSQSGYRGM